MLLTKTPKTQYLTHTYDFTVTALNNQKQESTGIQVHIWCTAANYRDLV